MRIATWVYAAGLSLSGAVNALMGMNGFRRDALRGVPDAQPLWLEWLMLGLGLGVLLLAAVGAYGTYASSRPWQRRRKGSLVPIGFGWAVAGFVSAPVVLLGIFGVEIGRYSQLDVEGDRTWGTGTWLIFWLPFAACAALFVVGIIVFFLGLRQYRADSGPVRGFGASLMGLPRLKGRIIALEPSGNEDGLDRIVVETANRDGLLHIVCVTDNAGRNGWMVDPRKKAKVRLVNNSRRPGDPAAWLVWVSTWRRLTGVLLQSRQVLLVGQPAPQNGPGYPGSGHPGPGYVTGPGNGDVIV